MSEWAPRQPMTGGEREILFQIQQLQANQREAYHRQRIEELSKNVRELTQEVQELKQQLAKDRLF
jgi:hypothetical protein